MSIPYSPSEIFRVLIKPDMDDIVNSNNLVCYTKNFTNGVLTLSLWPKPDTPPRQGQQQQDDVFYSASTIFDKLINPYIGPLVGSNRSVSGEKDFRNGVLTLSLWPREDSW